MLKIIQNPKFYLPIIYIVSAIVLYVLIAQAITKLSRINIKNDNKDIDKRKKTIVSLINNIIKYLIAMITIIMILNVYGINTTSIMASLGVVSVIIGLAFQDIIKDLLAGIFIIFDNAYSVGDCIEINGFKGEVISLGLKTTKIKSYTGAVKILSNSSFSEVTNYNINHSKIVILVPFPYNIKVEKVEEALKKVKEEIEKNNDVYQMDLLGIDEFKDSSIDYAIIVECVSNTQIAIKREVLKLIKKTFDQEKIEIPYNQLDVHIKE